MCCFNPKILFTSEEEDYMDEGYFHGPRIVVKSKNPYG